MEKKRIAIYRYAKQNIVFYIRFAQECDDLPTLEHRIAQREDCELVEQYKDIGCHCRCFDRPQFKQMMDDAKAHKFDFLIVESMSKISRDLCDAVSAVRQLTDLGIGVYFIEQKMSTDDEKFKTLFVLLSAIEDEKKRMTAAKKKRLTER